MAKNALKPFSQSVYQKSNELVTAKYSSDLLQNQITAIAMTRVEMNAKDKDYPLEANLYPSELKELVSDPTHIYRDVSRVVKSLAGKIIFMEDGNGNCMSVDLIPKATYQNKVLTIKFAPEMRRHLIGMAGDYTRYELSLMTSFKTNHAFRMYELLKTDAYKITEDNPCVVVEYRLSELRFLLGTAKIEDIPVKEYIEKNSLYVDWDYAISICNYVQYKEYKYFNASVLKVAQAELKEKADFRFEYTGIREGNETKRVRFYIYKNEPDPIEEVSIKERYLKEIRKPNRQSTMPLDTYPEFFEKWVGHNNLIDEDDLTLMLEKADYNLEKIENAINLADQQDYIRNYIGWILKCIEIGYEVKSTVRGDHEKAVVFEEIIDSVSSKSEEDKEESYQSSWNRQKANKEKWEAFSKEFEYEFGFTPEEAEAKYTYNELFACFASFIRQEKMSLPVVKEPKVTLVESPAVEEEQKIVIKPVKKPETVNPKKKLWEKAKQKAEFNDFEKLLKDEFGYEIEDLETAYSYEDLLKAFKAFQEGESFEL